MNKVILIKIFKLLKCYFGFHELICKTNSIGLMTYFYGEFICVNCGYEQRGFKK